MTGNLLLDWAIAAVSLFNMMLMLWLGLTVLLNVEHRDFGAWLLGSGLLLGAAFFTSHTAIVGRPLAIFSQGVNLWWQIGWVPIIVSPLVWYGLILWYVGFWDKDAASLRRRHYAWLLLMGGVGCVLLLLMLFTHALPPLTQIMQLNFANIPATSSRLWLLTLYPLFMVSCILLSIDALRHPVPSWRVMGDIARARTRPWLMAATATLLIISLLVAWVMLWSISSTGTLPANILGTAAQIDLVVASLIGLAVLFIGQAIVSYEVFTGRTLPRRGFLRQWYSVVILAAGYSALVAASLVLELHPVYGLLLTTILMITFYALFNWRSFVLRERFMAQLRPFAGSQKLSQHLLAPQEDGSTRANAIFQALCANVLNVARAQLLPMGVLAPLAGPPLTYPTAHQPSEFQPPAANIISSPAVRFVALAPGQHGGLKWAIPLWAERGLIGVIVLGDKVDGGLFAEEEIEIAQTSGERIVDMLAGEEMARRLMTLQRRRLVEDHVLDHRTRRTLHDEVLPELHAVILQISRTQNGDSDLQDAIDALTHLHHQIADLIRVGSVARPSTPGQSDLINDLRYMVESEFSAEFAAITWSVSGESPNLDPLVGEVLYHAVREVVRNAAIHGGGAVPEQPVNLAIGIVSDDRLSIAVQDDGVGLAHGTTPLPTLDGSSAGEAQGGLALHSTMISVVGGSLTLMPSPDGGARVTITVPLASQSPTESSLVTHHVV